MLWDHAAIALIVSWLFRFFNTRASACCWFQGQYIQYCATLSGLQCVCATYCVKIEPMHIADSSKLPLGPLQVLETHDVINFICLSRQLVLKGVKHSVYPPPPQQPPFLFKHTEF